MQLFFTLFSILLSFAIGVSYDIRNQNGFLLRISLPNGYLNGLLDGFPNGFVVGFPIGLLNGSLNGLRIGFVNGFLGGF